MPAPFKSKIRHQLSFDAQWSLDRRCRVSIPALPITSIEARPTPEHEKGSV